MRKHVSSSLARTAAVSLLLLGGGLGPAVAAKCQTTKSSCIDLTTKQFRTCTTTTCTDDKGNVTSSTTTVEMKGSSGTPKLKVPLPQAPATGGVKQ